MARKTPAKKVRAPRDATFLPLLRAKVREVLKMAPERKFTEQLLLDSVAALGLETTLEELREALLWNQSSGFVDYVFSRDYDRDEWFLTPRGKAKA